MALPLANWYALGMTTEASVLLSKALFVLYTLVPKVVILSEVVLNVGLLSRPRRISVYVLASSILETSPVSGKTLYKQVCTRDDDDSGVATKKWTVS